MSTFLSNVFMKGISLILDLDRRGEDTPTYVGDMFYVVDWGVLSRCFSLGHWILL